MKLPAISTFLIFLIVVAISKAQENVSCKNDTSKFPVRNFRSFSGYVPIGCTNFTWIFTAEQNKSEKAPNTIYMKFSSFNLTKPDTVSIKADKMEWKFDSIAQFIDHYMITNSNQIQVQLFSSSKDPVFRLDIFSQNCGGTFTDKGTLSCQSSEKPGSKFYQLTAKEGQQIIATLNSLDDSEQIEFYEGYNNNSSPLAVFTKSTPKYEVFSEKNAMLILVKSPDSKSNFVAQFESVDENTTFTSNDSSHAWQLIDAIPESNYTWRINPKGSDSDVIALSISDFNALANDSLVISQGLTHKPVLILKESLTSQRSFYFPSNDGVRVELFKGNETTNNQISVIITYNVVPDCKNSLESAPNSIASPGYPSQYFYNVACKWSIADKAMKSYRMSVKEFDSASTDKLTYDFGKITGQVDAQTSDIVFNNSVTFNWKSLINENLTLTSPKGFELDFQTYDCGYPVVISDTESLNFNGKFAKCFWTVEALRGEGEVNNIDIIVQSADKKLPLVIYDGGDSSAKPLPFQLKNGIFKATSRVNKLLLEISSDKLVAAFNVSFKKRDCPKSDQCKSVAMCIQDDWRCDGQNHCGDGSDEINCTTINDNCGGDQKRTVIDNSTIVTLVNVTYGNLNCYWKINSTKGRSLVAVFGNQSLLNSAEMLIILDGSDIDTAVKIMELTSESSNCQDNIITSSETLWIKFVSEGSKKSNFTLNITSQSIGHRTNATGDITIPPKQNKNETQIFEIELLKDQQVEALYTPKKSLPDWTLTLYDGFSTKQLPLAELRDGKVINTVVSSSNRMLVKAQNFHDISSGVLSIKSQAVGTYFINQTNAGSLYLNQVKSEVYKWQIKPEVIKNSIISLKLNQLNLIANETFILRRDDARDKMIAQINSSVYSPKVFHVPIESGAYIEYKSVHKTNEDNTQAMLSASYEVLASCVQEIKLNNYSPQTIISPGYPNIYPINAACNWTVTVPKSKLVHITFNDLNLNVKHPLVVNSMGKSILSVAGSDLPDDLLLTSEAASIEWTSAAFNESYQLGRGFSFTVRMFDCGGNVTDKESFTTPNYPHDVNETLHCGWAATVPREGKDKKLNIVGFTVRPVTHPNLIIYNGGSVRSPVLHNTTDDEMSLTNTVLFFYTYDNKSEDYYDYEMVDETNGIKVTFAPIACNRTCNASHLCMQDKWVCNGVNDCGDNSDEIDCTQPLTTTPGPTTPAPTTPAPPTPHCGAGWYVFAVIMGLLVGALLAIAIPILWRRFRGQENYQRFGEGES